MTMGIKLCNLFVKITGWLPQKLVFRTKMLYEDAAIQKRKISGPAILISNHTALFDYAIWLFVFIGRTLRFQMAEVLFRKKGLGLLLRLLGGIFVDRGTHDFGFVAKSEQILSAGGVVGIFPESRLPLEGEERPLPFKPSAAYLALSAGVPVIPVYTNGRYWTLRRAVVMIGTPMDVSLLTDPALSDKENIDRVTQAMRTRIMELGKKLDEQCGNQTK